MHLHKPCERAVFAVSSVQAVYRAGYIVGKYISIEKIISDTKDTYYEVLQESSYNWHEGNN
ncbi:MAG: hypothetical protein J6T42_03280, partial [Clostridia bacterium]|nr:hypothetical protein [Clostridia bacterium]